MPIEAIGVLAPAVDDGGLLRTQRGVVHAILKSGFHPVIVQSAPTPDSLLETIHLVVSSEVAGLIVISPHVWAHEVLECAEIRIPAIEISASSVSIDQRKGVSLLVDHLTGLGHERFQYIGGRPDFSDSHLRLPAFKSEVERAGSSFLGVVAIGWSAASGFKAAEALDPETTAIACSNDQVALGLIAGLRTLGRRIPPDVSVVGFDDISEAVYFAPSLTTVRQDFEGLGQVAVSRLLQQMGTLRDTELPLEPKLMIRASTSSPRS